MKPNTKPSSGFTLIELLVTIAIIGILASVVMLSVNRARARGRDAKRIGDIRQLTNAMEQYYTQHGAYPTGNGSTNPGGVALSDATAFDTSAEAFTPNYVPVIPVAPDPADGDCAGTGSGKNNYWYEAAADGSTYTLTLCLGLDNSDWHAGTRMVTPTGLQ